MLGIFSMLAMAHQQDEDQDLLEIVLRREDHRALLRDHKATLDDIRVAVNLDLEEGCATKPRRFINR